MAMWALRLEHVLEDFEPGRSWQAHHKSSLLGTLAFLRRLKTSNVPFNLWEVPPKHTTNDQTDGFLFKYQSSAYKKEKACLISYTAYRVRYYTGLDKLCTPDIYFWQSKQLLTLHLSLHVLVHYYLTEIYGHWKYNNKNPTELYWMKCNWSLSTVSLLFWFKKLLELLQKATGHNRSPCNNSRRWSGILKC